MSAFLARQRAQRYTIQLALGLSAGFALGLAVQQAHAEDTVASLMRDPHRLDAVQQGCKTNQPWATDAVCRITSEAIRRRFRGEGVPYTPHAIAPLPTQPLGPAPATKPEAQHPPTQPRASRVL